MTKKKTPEKLHCYRVVITVAHGVTVEAVDQAGAWRRAMLIALDMERACHHGERV